MKHGGDLAAAMNAFGGKREDWLDLSTGINPHVYPLPALEMRLWQALPSEADLQIFLNAARRAYDIPDQAGVVAAPGTQALIQWLPQLAPDGAVAVLGPTYSEHALAWRAAGRQVIYITGDGRWPEDARHLVVVNPNNPDGRLLDQLTLRSLAIEAAARCGWLVVDESFVDVIPEATAAALVAEYPVLILRSFGKFHGLAGVRLGALIAPDKIARRFAEALGPWAISGPALAIGAAALRDEAWARTMRQRLNQDREVMDDVLSATNFSVVGGTDLYRLVRHANAVALHRELAEKRIWVRSFDWDATLLRFGLPADKGGWVRLKEALAHSADHGSTTD